MKDLFIFAYESNQLSSDDKKTLRAAFKAALDVPNQIKQSIENTGNQVALNSAYFLDPDIVIKAINDVDGMAETGGESDGDSGTKVTLEIMDTFFQDVLSSLGGDVKVIQVWLQDKMNDFQVQIGFESNYKNFGNLIGTVAMAGDLGIPTTAFQYIYSDYSTSQWMEKLSCSDTVAQSYSYNYKVVYFEYDPS
ncbi:hypothetical protein P350_35800 [Burkholderia cepacia JBK9]|nr:hypothetical protein P350_35800 [Burkholderia cepacia JBK9]